METTQHAAEPADLAAALDAHPGARHAFEVISSGRRRAYVAGVASAKRPETRARRIERVVTELRW